MKLNHTVDQMIEWPETQDSIMKGIYKNALPKTIKTISGQEYVVRKMDTSGLTPIFEDKTGTSIDKDTKLYNDLLKQWDVEKFEKIVRYEEFVKDGVTYTLTLNTDSLFMGISDDEVDKKEEKDTNSIIIKPIGDKWTIDGEYKQYNNRSEAIDVGSKLAHKTMIKYLKIERADGTISETRTYDTNKYPPRD